MDFQSYVTLEFTQRQGYHQTRHFDFGIEYKPRLVNFKINCLLDEIYIELSVVFLKSFSIFMSPTSKKLTGHIGFGLCVRPSVRVCIPHGKIAETRFFSWPSYLPTWNYTPLINSE